MFGQFHEKYSLSRRAPPANPVDKFERTPELGTSNADGGGDHADSVPPAPRSLGRTDQPGRLAGRQQQWSTDVVTAAGQRRKAKGGN